MTSWNGCRTVHSAPQCLEALLELVEVEEKLKTSMKGKKSNLHDEFDKGEN